MFISAVLCVCVCTSRHLFAPDSVRLAKQLGFEKRHPIPRTGFDRTKRKEAGHFTGFSQPKPSSSSFPLLSYLDGSALSLSLSNNLFFFHTYIFYFQIHFYTLSVLNLLPVFQSKYSKDSWPTSEKY